MCSGLSTRRSPLIELYASACDALGREVEAYNPHLSLIYSEMWFADRITLVDAVDVDALPDAVELSTLALVETGSPVTE